MLTLLREGGFPVWFLLAFGLLTLGSSGRFAARPEPARLRLTVALSLTTFFSTLTAISADIAAVGHGAPDFMARHPQLPLSTVLLQGAAEAMSPAILGFTLLSLSALLVALGAQRELRG